ncbi:aminotransferase class V-fold PLP-dependent enzyme [Congregibacter sp.]|uniref:aminotransferase class V-fold PLP-dependent enzyme n=1 Tax=Congregibacter sp. TaxID=2744308 RepID=UPI003F6D61AF
MAKLVYFDYLSTTPVDPAVAEAMARCLTRDGTFGNPASRSHRFGWEAEMAVENARQQLATLINADLREIAWTSGATESDNLALKGVVEAAREAGNASPHVVTSAIEHKAVLDSCRHLESQGVAVSYLKPDEQGLITPDAVRDALQDSSCLVSVMHANNEIGTINDIAGIAAVCRAAGVPLHVDAAQSVGKIPVDVKALDVDLLSISAHKFYGPKGIGALYQRRSPRVAVAAQMHGGGHERGLRAGTLPTHQIVGMGQAAATAQESLTFEGARLTALREELWSTLSGIDGVTLNGHPTQRLPGALNISVSGVEGEALLLSLPEFALSTGSACTSASLEPSYVLRALGLPDALAHSSLRVSLGRFSDENEVQLFSERLHEVVSRLRRDAA